jgi:hypothetical protein
MEDKETAALREKAKNLSLFVKGDDWSYVKDKFAVKIMDLQSIKNLADVQNESELFHEIKVRNGVVDVLLEIIKEVEGEAAQFDNHKQNIEVVQEYVVRM